MKKLAVRSVIPFMLMVVCLAREAGAQTVHSGEGYQFVLISDWHLELNTVTPGFAYARSGCTQGILGTGYGEVQGPLEVFGGSMDMECADSSTGCEVLVGAGASAMAEFKFRWLGSQEEQAFTAARLKSNISAGWDGKLPTSHAAVAGLWSLSAQCPQPNLQVNAELPLSAATSMGGFQIGASVGYRGFTLGGSFQPTLSAGGHVKTDREWHGYADGQGMGVVVLLLTQYGYSQGWADGSAFLGGAECELSGYSRHLIQGTLTGP